MVKAFIWWQQCSNSYIFNMQDEPVGVDTDDSEDDSSIPLEVYLKKGEQVTINNYDYKFTLPMDGKILRSF